jgi:hypothetical protein
MYLYESFYMKYNMLYIFWNLLWIIGFNRIQTMASIMTNIIITNHICICIWINICVHIYTYLYIYIYIHNRFLRKCMSNRIQRACRRCMRKKEVLRIYLKNKTQEIVYTIKHIHTEPLAYMIFNLYNLYRKR